MPAVFDGDAALEILAGRPGLRDSRNLFHIVADVRLEYDHDGSIFVAESRMMVADWLWRKALIMHSTTLTRIAAQKRACAWVAAEAAHLPEFVFGFVLAELHGRLVPLYGFLFHFFFLLRFSQSANPTPPDKRRTVFPR
jgi:hypothetical protein